MRDFDVFMPTRIVFGETAEEKLGKYLQSYSSNILVVMGGQSIRNIGLYDRIISHLSKFNIHFTELSGVMPNPKVDLVRQGITMARDKEVTFILAVGGGSVIDTAKAIAAGYFYDGDVWELFSQGKTVAKCLPVGVVLTVPGAGSETSNGGLFLMKKPERSLDSVIQI